MFSSPHRFLGQNRRGATSKTNYYINHHVGLVVLTDIVSPITTSAVKPTFDLTSPGSTSGRKPTKKVLVGNGEQLECEDEV